MQKGKLKTRSEASRQKLKIEISWGEASLRAFSFASLSRFKENWIGQLFGHFSLKG